MSRRKKYHQYLKSPEWEAKRQLILWSGDHQCATCTRKNQLHVHHRTYERVGEEAFEDLVVLCKFCHQALHATLELTNEGFEPKGERTVTVAVREGVSRRQQEEEDWILLAALENHEWALQLISLHAFRTEESWAISHCILDGTEPPAEYAPRLAELRERLRKYGNDGFGLERATRLLRDLLCRHVEWHYDNLVEERQEACETLRRQPTANRDDHDSIEAMTRRQLELRTLITRMKGTNNNSWDELLDLVRGAGIDNGMEEMYRRYHPTRKVVT